MRYDEIINVEVRVSVPSHQPLTSGTPASRAARCLTRRCGRCCDRSRCGDTSASVSLCSRPRPSSPPRRRPRPAVTTERRPRPRRRRSRTVSDGAERETAAASAPGASLSCFPATSSSLCRETRWRRPSRFHGPGRPAERGPSVGRTEPSSPAAAARSTSRQVCGSARAP